MRNLVPAAMFLWVFATASSALSRDLPDFDAVSRARAIPNADAALTARTAPYIRAGTRAQGDNRFGVPTFLWAGRDVQSPSQRPGTLPSGNPQEAAARAHLENYASLYNLSAEDAATATVRYVHDIGRGPVIVKFIQKLGGVEILLEELSVVMNRDLDLVAISGFISSADTPGAGAAATWNLDGGAAAAAAYNDLTGRTVSASQLTAEGSRDGYDLFEGAQDLDLDIPIRLRRVYFHLPEGLVPAYHIEVAVRNEVPAGELREAPSRDLDYYAYVVSAEDGSLLLRRNLTVYESAPQRRTRARGAVAATEGGLGPGGFSYQVWADAATGIPLDGPQGNDFQPKVIATNDNASPTLIPSNLVTLPNYPFSMNDPWLPPGSTETVGNNTDAYVDLVTPNGFGVVGPPQSGISNDFRAQLTGVDTFGNSYNTAVRPNDGTQRLAAIQQMFYNVNFLHDWYYDYGFDEASLNAQTNNFGRGGIGNDPINSEGQDMSNLDNANMNTPADGARPRMQMFIFQARNHTSSVAQPPAPVPANTDGRFVAVLSPPSVATVLTSGTVQFGQQPFDLTNDVVLANPPAACGALTNAAAVAGKFVLVERQATGGPVCALQAKLAHAQNAGAVGFILINNQSTPTTGVSFLGFLNTGALGVPPNGPVTMAISTITWNEALPLKTELAVPNVVSLRIKRDVDRDGTIDTQIMMHEWGHYLQNRVIGNSLGLINNQGGGMGEGWGDFTALLFTVREDDILVASNANWNGVYGIGAYTLTGGNSQAGYFGIRRYPQTTDMTKNPLTLGHIVTGAPLPPGIPMVPKAADNAQVHNTGEVWSVALWECYASLLRDTIGPNPRLTFQQAQDRINMYYIAALKMTPLRPTLLSARDAMLAAAYAHDTLDYAAFWTAFAKRGYGIDAVAADPYSTNHVGTVESFTVGGELLFQGAELSTGTTDCDGDGMLDSGDTVTLNVTLKNTGNGDVAATTGVASSTDPNVTFTGGGAISFSSADPQGLSIGSVGITYAPAIVGIQTIPVEISYNDPSLGVAGPRIVNIQLRVNTNTVFNNTVTDSVESERLAWTPTVVNGAFPGFSTNTPWRRLEVTPTDHRWFGTDPDAMQDQALVSPVLTIDGGGTLNIQWDHTWGFEFDGGGNYDGGVVEMSINGGAWTDIGVGGVNSYNGTILNQPTASPPPPLGGRPGFVANNPGAPASVHTTLTPAVAAGNTVQIRFRLGSDQIFGGAGWRIDDVAFTGVIETPFDTVIADAGCAVPTTTTALISSANPSPFGSALTLTATVSGTGSPTGSVTFFDGGSDIGTALLSGGVANLVNSTLAIGPHSLSASYSGDTSFTSSTSGTLSQTIAKVVTTTDLASSLEPSTIGDTVTFTATVSAVSGAATGSVTFLNGATQLGAIALTGNAAAFPISTLSCGSHTIHANYEGSSVFAVSTDSFVQTVNPPATPTPTNGGPYVTGQTIELTTPDVPGATYAWTGPLSFTSSDREPTITNAQPANSGTYSVTVTVNSCTSAAGSTVVVVGDPPGRFYTLTPCRLFDSRSGSALAHDVVIDLDVVGSCGIPADTKALAVNVIAVGATADGELILDNAGNPAALAVVPFAAGAIRADNTLCRVAADGSLFVRAVMDGPGDVVHVVIDVFGYFN